MALQLSYTSPSYGLIAPTAYAKIDTYRGDINHVTFNVNYYATQTARLEGLCPIDNFQFTVSYQDGMTYASVYAYLKTLPGFENAVDC